MSRTPGGVPPTEKAQASATGQPRNLAELFASWGPAQPLNPADPRAFTKLAARYAELLQLIHRHEAALSEIEPKLVVCSDKGVAQNIQYEGKIYVPEAAPSATRAPTWQPIETAPKDGTWILMWRGGTIGRMDQARWKNNCLGKMCWGGESWNYPDGMLPSHWMPLPEAPK